MSLTLVEIPGVRAGLPAVQHCVTSEDRFSSSVSLEILKMQMMTEEGLQGMQFPFFLR